MTSEVGEEGPMKPASPPRPAAARVTFPKVGSATTPQSVGPASRGYPSRLHRSEVFTLVHSRVGDCSEAHRGEPRSGQATRSAWPRDCAPDSGSLPACEASFACCRSRKLGVSRAGGSPPLPPILPLSQEPSDPGLSAFPSRPGRSEMLWKGTGVVAVFPREEDPWAGAFRPATMPVVD